MFLKVLAQMRLVRSFLTLILFILISFSTVFSQQDLDRIGKAQMKSMLSTIKNEIKKNYYDEKFRGVDIEARFKKAEERIDQVNSVAQAFAVIAQVLIDFDDSHLFFMPPATTVSVEYGFRMKMIGDRTFVTSVKPKSDAEIKGLGVGDQILSFENFRPTRNDLWKMRYFYYTLSPRTSLRLKIVHPNQEQLQEISFNSKVTHTKKTTNLWDTQDVNDIIRESEDAQSRRRHYFQQVGNATIWKMETFVFNPAQVDQIMQNTVKKNPNLILDLRGNGGGYIKTLENLAGYFTEKEAKIADRKGRSDKKKENESSIAKSQGNNAFRGRLVVLIDNDSGSAAEMFARFIQLEKRGIVIGDVSAGAVMQSIQYPEKYISGINNEVYYGVSITNAEVTMSDGKTIEKVGVKPDETILLTGVDLSENRDPVLARALESLGNKISPEEAGKLFKDHTWDD